MSLSGPPSSSAGSSSSSPNAASSPTPSPPLSKSGLRAALEYTGIPPSFITRLSKPSSLIPGRNWLIFLGVTSSVVGYYTYDRRECSRIREEVVERVRWMGEEVPMKRKDGSGFGGINGGELEGDHLAWPRKVVVYGAKWPGDEDYDQAMRFFRRYIKPIFVAAAIDYDMVVGKKHGDIANRIADEIHARRRLEASTNASSSSASAQPPMPQNYLSLTPAQREQHELQGGILIIGRPTWKEFMAGLRKGWTEDPYRYGPRGDEKEEVLARELEGDGVFDEVEVGVNERMAGDADMNAASTSTSAVPFSPMQYRLPSSSSPPSSSSSPATPTISTPIPERIPPVPPLLLVPFTDYLGFSQIPHMLWDFFNERHKVRRGAEAAEKVVWGHTRGVNVPSLHDEPNATEPTDNNGESEKDDLSFDRTSESYYRSSLSSTLSSLSTARQKFYDALPARLSLARAYARGTLSPEELEELEKKIAKDPKAIPASEVELRQERQDRERRWRGEEEGWGVVRQESGVMWDPRMRGVLRVFCTPEEEEGTEKKP